MTHSMIKTLSLFAAIATVAAAGASSAEAGRAKEYFSQTYRFKQAMKGVEGQQGNFYCSYINTPVRKCDGQGRCKIVAYEMMQHCY